MWSPSVSCVMGDCIVVVPNVGVQVGCQSGWFWGALSQSTLIEVNEAETKCLQKVSEPSNSPDTRASVRRRRV